jgi:uncharacterized coiled-coil DUF342 family protein
MTIPIDELEKNIIELIKRYNKLKEENINLQKKLTLLKTKVDESDSRRIKVVNKLTKVINEIEKYITEEQNTVVTSRKGNE